MEEGTIDKSANKHPALITLQKTDSSNPDFLMLVGMLDQELQIRDGEDHSFYAPFNTLVNIHHIIVAYSDNLPVGCGAFRPYPPDSVEIKRMFVHPAYRNRGIASLILDALEKWAEALHFQECMLETGFNQPEAIALYTKTGYEVIPNYGPYENVPSSVCMRKIFFNSANGII